MSHWQSWTESLLHRKRAPDTIHSMTTDRYVGLYPVSLLSQPLKQWRKPNICQQHATRLTRPIPPTCDRYVQYLLVGAIPSVLKRYRRGLQSWSCQFFTYHSPTFLTSCLHFSPKGYTRSSVQPRATNNNSKLEFKKPMTVTWSFDNSTMYHNLHLCLTITNVLSLAMGFTRNDQKVVLMQLAYQFNSYNLMHIQVS
jgi:hypothetical protein